MHTHTLNGLTLPAKHSTLTSEHFERGAICLLDCWEVYTDIITALRTTLTTSENDPVNLLSNTVALGKSSKVEKREMGTEGIGIFKIFMDFTARRYTFCVFCTALYVTCCSHFMELLNVDVRHTSNNSTVSIAKQQNSQNRTHWTGNATSFFLVQIT